MTGTGTGTSEGSDRDGDHAAGEGRPPASEAGAISSRALLRPQAYAVSSSGRSSGSGEVRLSETLEGYQQRALVSLLCFWLLVSVLSVGDAVLSDWPPPPELPTGDQVRQARENVWAAGAMSVVPPLGGLVLARRWRSAPWTATFLVGLLFAVLVTGVVALFTDTPVRPG
jgi:hypothetical protein